MASSKTAQHIAWVPVQPAALYRLVSLHHKQDACDVVGWTKTLCIYSNSFEFEGLNKVRCTIGSSR